MPGIDEDLQRLAQTLKKAILGIRTTDVEELLKGFYLTLDISVSQNLASFSWYMQNTLLHTDKVYKNPSGLIVLKKDEIGKKGIEKQDCRVTVSDLCDCCGNALNYIRSLSTQDIVVVKNFDDASKVELVYAKVSKPLSLFPRTTYTSTKPEDVKSLNTVIETLSNQTILL